MSARRSQIDRAIEKLNADILNLQSARAALIQIRAETKTKKTTKPRPVAKAAGE